MSPPRAAVAIVGRANVGKSTLVNRLLGHRAAIEHPDPGVTRDRQGYDVDWGGSSFTVIDTGGWEPRARGLTAKVAAQAARAARDADLIVFVVDAQVGITNDDLAVARILRRAEIPVLVAANKVDSAAQEADAASLERLGFGAPFPVSALHGRGSGDLMDAVAALLERHRVASAVAATPDQVRVAIAGRPNVGKSSLLNRLCGDERAIVDETPGTTRDAVDTVVEIDGRRIRFVDTAGIRKRARQAQGAEYYGLVRSLRAIDDADVVLHVIDAADGPGEQDQKIARHVVDAGRALVLLLNKWDLIGGPEAGVALEDDVRDRLGFVSWAPLVRVSAQTGRGIRRVPAAIERARGAWETRIPTAALNTWLRRAAERVPSGGRGARPIRLGYATQAGIRPPEIVLFATGQPSAGALRGLERRLRERFGFEGTPIRFAVRRRAPRR